MVTIFGDFRQFLAKNERFLIPDVNVMVTIFGDFRQFLP
jgi:hypothetical protein